MTWQLAVLGFIVWMFAWPLAAKYERYGAFIAACGALALLGGLLATR